MVKETIKQTLKRMNWVHIYFALMFGSGAIATFNYFFHFPIWFNFILGYAMGTVLLHKLTFNKEEGGKK